MDERYNTYRIWAPDDALWTQWAKPVLFAHPPQSDPWPLTLPEVSWAPRPDGYTAVITDQPGASGVLEGLSLAPLGYRPVPLYNGVPAPNNQAASVNVSGIISVLYNGAAQLSDAALPTDAPPAFLLDANRMNGQAKQPGRYDNRWCVFPQDMPSADFMIHQGIGQVFVHADSIPNDFTHLLRRYQEKGKRILHFRDYGAVRELEVIRPSHFKGLMYRFSTMLGLTQNAAGGFGGRIPEPTQTSGERFYGVG